MVISDVREIPLGDIQLQGANVRSDLQSPNSQEGLQELAESIKVNGLMQPIVLRGTWGNPPYDVIVGQRRFLAHQLLGTPTIKATFTGEIGDTEALILSLSENLLRQELNHADIAKAVTALYEEFGKDEYQVKAKLGLSIKAIRNYITVEAQATPKIKQMLQESRISMADAKRAILAAQGNEAKADSFADQISSMTKHDKIRAVEYGKANPKASVEEIITKAQTPKLEETVILNLPLKVSKALKAATKQLSVDSEEIIMNALTDWLKTNDFLLET